MTSVATRACTSLTGTVSGRRFWLLHWRWLSWGRTWNWTFWAAWRTRRTFRGLISLYVVFLVFLVFLRLRPLRPSRFWSWSLRLGARGALPLSCCPFLFLLTTLDLTLIAFHLTLIFTWRLVRFQTFFLFSMAWKYTHHIFDWARAYRFYF